MSTMSITAPYNTPAIHQVASQLLNSGADHPFFTGIQPIKREFKSVVNSRVELMIECCKCNLNLNTRATKYAGFEN